MGREIVSELRPFRQLCRNCSGRGKVVEFSPSGAHCDTICPVCEGYGVVQVTKIITTKLTPYKETASGQRE